MSFKTLFQASFEESLNIEKDTFYQYANKTYEQAIKTNPNGWSRLNQITMLVLTILFPLGMNSLLALASAYVASNHDSPEFTIVTSNYNFLPFSLHWSLFGIWIAFILIGRLFFTQNYLFVYRTHFHIQVVYCTWFFIEVNLLALTVFYPTLKWIGVLLFYMSLVFVGYISTRNRMRSLRRLLYQSSLAEETGKIDKVLQRLIKYAFPLVGLWIIFRIIFPEIGEVRTDFIGMLTIILIWYAANAFYLLLESNLFFPYFLHVYYKLKYPEEYRNWEGKSLEEWYGEKYLKKHKEKLK